MGISFCQQCGSAIKRLIPPMDDRERDVCSACGFIHYQNPNIIVGALITDGAQVLLCKRAIEPRYGLWTLPAGFMENGETTLDGALRETKEEAGATMDNPMLYRVFDVPHINQVYMFYRGQLHNHQFAVGQESLEVALFDEKDIPWDSLAFPVMSDILSDFFADRRNDNYPVRFGVPSHRLNSL